MATISIPKELYDKLVKLGKEPAHFVTLAAEEKLAAEEGQNQLEKVVSK